MFWSMCLCSYLKNTYRGNEGVAGESVYKSNDEAIISSITLSTEEGWL